MAQVSHRKASPSLLAYRDVRAGSIVKTSLRRFLSLFPMPGNDGLFVAQETPTQIKSA
ncbi:MAG: hypothetical protein KDI82_09380 [Gammaproteobacteria bacterium]|nr:hypothetical protein [Gammaproteobacteria bacterium]